MKDNALVNLLDERSEESQVQPDVRQFHFHSFREPTGPKLSPKIFVLDEGLGQLNYDDSRKSDVSLKTRSGFTRCGA